MKDRLIGALPVLGLTVIVFMSMLTPGEGQATRVNFPRTTDNKPDFNGVWQAMNTANWDIQDHQAKQGPLFQLGAAFSVPAGQGVVVGNEIPYKPEALKKKQENAASWMKLDPEVKCYMPGVPRATYMPYPFHIVQTPSTMLIAYEFASTSRIININGTDEAPVDSWMGWSNARWEGDTLVVDATGLNGESWFDRAGNYQTNTTHIVERYTPMTRDVVNYEVTVEDPAIYTRPWKMTMPLYRRMEKNAQIVEYKCVEFAEELLYGHLKKPGTK